VVAERRGVHPEQVEAIDELCAFEDGRFEGRRNEITGEQQQRARFAAAVFLYDGG